MLNKKIFLSVGLPGCGKSTYLQNNFNLFDPGVMRISADAIRNLLYGSENEQGNGGVVFNVVYHLFRYAMANDTIHTILIDNTNIDYETRNRFYTIAKEFDNNCYFSCTYEFSLVIFADHDLAYERNKNRDRVVPEFVLDRMKTKFQPTTKHEQHMEVYYGSYPKV